MDENLIIDYWKLHVSRCDVKKNCLIIFNASCDAINTFQGKVPAYLWLSSFLVCLSLRVPKRFLEGKLYLFSK